MIDPDKALGGDTETVMRTAAEFLEVFLRESGLDKHPVVEGMMAGNTAAQSMGLTRDDLDVLYALGFGFLNKGELDKAQEVFFRLVAIDPLEAKNHYCMGVICQMKGDHKVAGDMFVNFLALDATNADGYLRYGETRLALGERAEAREAFEIALAEAEKGNGDAAAIAEARNKLAMMKAE